MITFRQWLSSCLRIAQKESHIERNDTDARSSIPHDDSGEDRAVSSFDEKRDQSTEILDTMGIGTRDRTTNFKS
jgi:hypothetical protein